jgi:hypothetical protein
MNEALYNAVFGYGEKKVDPFAKTNADFDRIISDMKLVGYEITAFNVAHQIMLEALDDLLKTKHSVIEQTMDIENRDQYCRENYGLSFKDTDALDPTNDIEWDIKSGQVIFYLTHDAKHKEEAYFIFFKKNFDEFTSKTGFKYISQ